MVKYLAVIMAGALCITAAAAEICKKNYDQCLKWGGGESGCANMFNECRGEIERLIQKEIDRKDAQVSQIGFEHSLCLSDADDKNEICNYAVRDTPTATICVTKYLAQKTYCQSTYENALKSASEIMEYNIRMIKGR